MKTIESEDFVTASKESAHGYGGHVRHADFAMFADM